MSRLRLGLLIPWALFVAACVGWTIYWFGAKDAAIRALDAGLAQAKEIGVDAGYSGVRASGYPLRLTLTLSDARASAGRVRVDAARLPVSVNLSNPRHVIVGLADGLRWERGDGVVHRLSASGAQLSVRTGNRGGLARFSLDLANARVSHGVETDVTTIGKLLLHLRPDPRRAADAQLVIDVTDWAGPTPFAALNAAAPYKTFRTAAVITDYATLAAPKPLEAWTGALRIEQLDVAYDDTRVTGAGALDLDAAHRVTGEITLTPDGGQKVTLAAANGWWTLAGLRIAPAKPLD